MSIELNSPGIIYTMDPEDHLRQIVYKYDGYPLPEDPEDDTPRYLSEIFTDDAAEIFQIEEFVSNIDASPTVDLEKNFVDLYFGSETDKGNDVVFFLRRHILAYPFGEKA